MRINCPHCGMRDQGEFTYLGDASVRRPAPSAGLDAWVDYVYLRDNAAGAQRELWYHALGCRGWLEVERNTASHEIPRVRPANGGAP